MSFNWDGFLMGVSDYGAERLKEERQKKMQAQLLQLKEKYEIAAEERAEKRANSKVDSNQTLENFDPATGTGTVQKYNPRGELLSESALSPGRIAELQANARKAELDNANTQSQIDSRKEELALRRAGLDIDRERNSLTRRGLEAAAPTDAEPRSTEQVVENLANEIVSSYPLDKIQMQGPEGIQNMSRLRRLARETAWSAIRSGDPASAYDMFDRAVTTNSGWQSRP